MAAIPIKTTATNNLTVTIPAGSSAGSVSIVSGGSGGGGSGYSYGPSLQGSTWSQTTNQGKIHVQGDAVFEGDITWRGRNMREWFESVEARLALLRPNPELEEDWEELADLRQRYVELERDIIAKQQLFDILKKE